MASVPVYLLRDPYWAPVIYLFQKNSKLKSVFTTKYFDLDDRTIKIDALKRTSKPWSSSEKFMLALALHLFNERNKVNISGIDYLDENNKELAFEAMQMRFNYKIKTASAVTLTVEN